MKSAWAYHIRSEASTLEIDIYDVIGAGLLGGITASDILAQLKASKDAKKVLVRINSGGGEVTQGMAIYSLLREAASNGSDVTCRIDGLAASIATIIACAGTKVEMADSAFFMVHNPSAMIEGSESDLRSMADLLGSMRIQMLNIYADRTGKPVDELAALCDAETWMTAEQAKANGFITDIIPARQARMVAQAKWDLTQFKKVPTGLGVKAMDEKEAEALKAENEKLKAQLAKLEEEKDDKPEASAAPEEEPDEDEDKDAKATAQARVLAAAKAITGVQDLEALEGALMALSTKAKGTKSGKIQHVENVNKAVSEGKLLPSLKAWALEATPKSFASYLKSLGDDVVAPIGLEIKQAAEDTAKAIAFNGVTPTSELTKSEKALAAQMKITEADLKAMKAKQLQS